MDNIIIRKGKPEDADPANKLIYSTGDYFFDYIYILMEKLNFNCRLSLLLEDMEKFGGE